MGIVTKLVNSIVNLSIILAMLAVAMVPVVYHLGHERQHQQEWN